MAGKSIRYADHEISAMLESDSRSDDTSEDDTTDEDAGSTPASHTATKKILMREKANVSFRIKLRRSTEQSMYKIQIEDDDETSEQSASESSYKRARSNSSDTTNGSPLRDRRANEETPKRGSRIVTPPRSSRSRRPPSRFANYDWNGMSSSNYYEQSPKTSDRLRSRQHIDYNELSLQLKCGLVESTPPKRSNRDKTITRNSKREDTPSGNEVTVATVRKTRVELKKRILKDQVSEKETDSDSSSLSSIRATRAKPLKTMQTQNDNKENMLRTPGMMDVTPNKSNRRRGRSVQESGDIVIPVVDLTSSASPAKDRTVDSRSKGKKDSSSSVHESDSDTSVRMLENLNGSNEYEIKPSISSMSEQCPSTHGTETVSKSAGNIQIGTPHSSNKSNRISMKSVTPVKLTRTKRNLSKEIHDSDALTMEVLNNEEELYEHKKGSKHDGAKTESPSVMRTTKRQTGKQDYVSENVLSTPKTRLLKHSNLTPSIESRSSAPLKPATPLQNARARLHVGAVPKSLPCREEEFNNIFTFLKGKLMDRTGGCIYISGVPGTGKTATVNEVIRCLERLTQKGELHPFNFVTINGVKLTEPRQSYVQILKQLTGETVPWVQACRTLQERFQRRSSKMTLLLVDELDYLCTKRQDVIYNILDWPSKQSAHLVVITIANTMDLPERVLMARVASRLGLTRLTFQPYDHRQLQQIVITRMKGFDSFRSEAIQLVARKVSAVSGDARRALDICRRATEITELRGAETISLDDVTQAISEMIASPKIRAISRCSALEQMFLLAISAEVMRTSVEEVLFRDAYMQFKSICSFEGLKIPNVSETLAICARLGASRILICDHSRFDIYQKILLNVSADDIHYAIQQSNKKI